MRRVPRFACMLVGFSLATTSCMKLDLFKRSEPVVLAQGLPVGTPAPEIEGDDFDGSHFKLSDYRGKVVVLSFWTSW